MGAKEGGSANILREYSREDFRACFVAVKFGINCDCLFHLYIESLCFNIIYLLLSLNQIGY